MAGRCFSSKDLVNNTIKTKKYLLSRQGYLQLFEDGLH